MNKTNYVTLIVGLVLAAIFGLLLFTFQVRQTEVALVTTFGKPARDIDEPGLYWKLPWPVQRVQKFDKRIQSFEDKFEETATQDGRNILIMLYLGWSIDDPAVFRERFDGSISRAQAVLEGWTRSAKNEVVGRHRFSHFISTDETELKFVEIETVMLESIQPQANRFGMEVNFLGIQRLRLPESVTENVFDRMREERQVAIETLRADGQREAAAIRSGAERERAEILAAAEAQAMEIRGQAEAEGAPYYATLERNPELAVLLLKLSALELALKSQATLVFTERQAPFDLLNSGRPQQVIPAPHSLDAAASAKN